VTHVKPKTIRKVYKRHSYVLTYLPPSHTWRWEVTYVSTTVFSETASSMTLAQRAAERHIDESIKVMKS
jgi:hypothetical protein